MAKHGIFATENGTSVTNPIVAESGIPFVVGSAPVHSAESPAHVGLPILCESWNDAVTKLGYSDDWKNYTLCEFMYAHFKLYGRQPVVFVNVLDPATMKEAVPAADIAVVDHKATLPGTAIDGITLVVKAASGSEAPYVKGTDYDVYYIGEQLMVEVLPDGACYSAAKLNIAYDKVTPSSVDETAVAMGFEAIEHCVTRVGIVPDLLCAPGFSGNPVVAAVMATKAFGINGMFRAKALIDLDAATVKTSADAVSAKATGNMASEDEIVCWPQVSLGGKVFHLSTHLAGLIAQVDSGNSDCPYESPSNKSLQIDALVLADGSEVNQTLAQANTLNAAGILTALNFMGGFVAWGNYTACYPANADVKDYFIPVSRMFDFVGNTLIRTFWSKLDAPMNRRLIDTIMDQSNIWLNGLVGSGYLLGARAEFVESENPTVDLMAGIIRIHVYLTPPSPAQEIDFVLEYDAEYVSGALQS